MNAIVKAEPRKLMLLEYMADKYSLNPDEFGRTVRATCGLSTATPEQVAAFLIVAKEYNLNPLTKEIYAFPGRGGGVVPIVSIDGWVNLVNSHPQCDGFEFQAEHDAGGKLFSFTCSMHRKDRKYPTIVTEYLSECIRATDPWKMQHRMLRHKSLIQAARYAFGFAGIYDEDEGRTIAEADAPPRDAAPPRNVTVIEHKPAEETGSHLSGDPVDDLPQDPSPKTATKAADGPHMIAGDNHTYASWTTAYIDAVQTAGDTPTVYAWVDANAPKLEKLAKGSPVHAAKARSETEKHLAFLRKTDPISSGPQKPADDFPGDTPMEATEKPKAARGRPKGTGKTRPDMSKDYDGWVSWHLMHMAAVETPEALEALFEAIDTRWDDILTPDRETLMGARRDAESRMEQ